MNNQLPLTSTFPTSNSIQIWHKTMFTLKIRHSNLDFLLVFHKKFCTPLEPLSIRFIYLIGDDTSNVALYCFHFNTSLASFHFQFLLRKIAPQKLFYSKMFHVFQFGCNFARNVRLNCNSVVFSKRFISDRRLDSKTYNQKDSNGKFYIWILSLIIGNRFRYFSFLTGNLSYWSLHTFLPDNWTILSFILLLIKIDWKLMKLCPANNIRNLLQKWNFIATGKMSKSRHKPFTPILFLVTQHEFSFLICRYFFLGHGP